VFHPRYDQAVSFERSAYVRSPNVSASEIEPVLARLDALELLLVRTAARSAAGDEALGYSDAEQRAEARERASVLWTDLAFEQGVLLVYPGNTHFPAGFETRQRSWYTATARHWGAVWGSPYPDATSGAPIIACSSAFFDAQGQRAGVAALHMPLEDVLSELELRDVAGFRGAALLDAQGNVVLSEQTRERRRSAGLHENQPLERPPFAVEEVRAAVASGAREGRVHSAGALTVFESLDSTGWLLAVTVDGTPYGWH
jgi:methyl-accepting chemotaxis protein